MKSSQYQDDLDPGASGGSTRSNTWTKTGSDRALDAVKYVSGKVMDFIQDFYDVDRTIDVSYQEGGPRGCGEDLVISKQDILNVSNVLKSEISYL